MLQNLKMLQNSEKAWALLTCLHFLPFDLSQQLVTTIHLLSCDYFYYCSPEGSGSNRNLWSAPVLKRSQDRESENSFANVTSRSLNWT